VCDSLLIDNVSHAQTEMSHKVVVSKINGDNAQVDTQVRNPVLLIEEKMNFRCVTCKNTHADLTKILNFSEICKRFPGFFRYFFVKAAMTVFSTKNHSPKPPLNPLKWTSALIEPEKYLFFKK
jgi:hypothetical protein